MSYEKRKHIIAVPIRPKNVMKSIYACLQKYIRMMVTGILERYIPFSIFEAAKTVFRYNRVTADRASNPIFDKAFAFTVRMVGSPEVGVTDVGLWSLVSESYQALRKSTYFDDVAIFFDVSLERCVRDPMCPSIAERRIVFDSFILLFELEVGVDCPD